MCAHTATEYMVDDRNVAVAIPMGAMYVYTVEVNETVHDVHQASKAYWKENVVACRT